MKDIVIIGAGGFGREVAWLIEDINKVNREWNIIGFVDDNEKIKGTKINGYEVIGNVEWLRDKELYIICAIGDTVVKKGIIQKFNESKCKFPRLIHPSAIYSNTVKIGEGSVICAGVIVTVNIQIGKHVIINLDSTVGHDCIIGDFSTIAPSVNVSGCVIVEESVNIGTGTAIIEGRHIGNNSVIGAGSVVVKDIPRNCTAVGSPAKPIKFGN